MQLLFQTYYTLNVDSNYGDAGDALMWHSGYKFTTIDKDNDGYGSNCAVDYKGGWW